MSITKLDDAFYPGKQALSMQQLYRISTMYCDDKYGTLGIPPEVCDSNTFLTRTFTRFIFFTSWTKQSKLQVVSSMRTKMVQQGSNSPSTQDDINSFLLDDDFRYSTFFPFVSLTTISVTWWSDPFPISCCSIPFSIDDIAKLMVHIDIADMDLPPLIQENKGSPHLMP